ncbi:MAG: hypothetical protein IPK25_00140 [Saprospiraceae bacterium]|nr:hypothetical protein [Saprospiraceae bacterium]
MASTTNGATGAASVAMGQQTIASGNTSTALGINSTASGTYSTAMGASTNATGYASTAMGSATTASDFCAVAMGHLPLHQTCFYYGKAVLWHQERLPLPWEEIQLQILMPQYL